jgi:hypothetical protein
VTPPVFRYDTPGAAVPAFVEDCAHCGADLNLAGNCSAACEASRKQVKSDDIRQERHG